MLKDDPPEQLIAADPHGRRRRRAALAGGHAARDPAVHADPAPRARPKALDELTERELEVFRLIAGGLSNAEIASTLFIEKKNT